ncbi:MAG TPA: PDZ domain-containing protein [Clostridia bacterium]|nr:PDZ domain-containing protein [Clostridia bacterium]
MVFVDPCRGFLFFLVIFLIASQYRRIAATEERLYGIPKNQVFDQVLSATLYGFLGGVFGSLIMVFVGVSLSYTGIAYLWPLALLLMLINPRFICFSYAGGIISISNLVFGWPKVDVPGLAALVGILHVTEAMLIRISGGTCITPIMIRNKRGKVVSGFSLQKFWPVPIIVLLAVSTPEAAELTGLIRMPDWWPLVRPDGITPDENLIYIMIPVVAALGYGDIAIISPPSLKLKRTSLSLSVYSATLLGLAILSSWIRPLRWAAALFAPLGHEAVIRAGMRGEFTDEPYLQYREGEVTVLDVMPKSPAARAGIQSGDVILEANGIPVRSASDIKMLGESGVRAFHILLRRDTDAKRGGRFEIIHTRLERTDETHLGLITVPDATAASFVEIKKSMPLMRLIEVISRLVRSRKR